MDGTPEQLQRCQEVGEDAAKKLNKLSRQAKAELLKRKRIEYKRAQEEGEPDNDEDEDDESAEDQ